MKTLNVSLLVLLAYVSGSSTIVCAAQADSILENIGVTRGICVMLGDGAAERAIELARKSELLIYVQSPDARAVQAAREAADAAGLYGTRIFVDKGPANKLNLADSLADAVVGSAAGVLDAEVLRVLRPGGKAVLEGRTLVKPPASGVDDWSHPYHGPDNNPQSSDKVIKAPYLTQFLAEPRYAPVPQVAVVSAGRAFKAFGHVAFKAREEPYLNKLVAFNGYNGTILWQRDLTEGVMIHRNTMIAAPDVLYLGDDKSCKVIDAATGKLLDEIIPPVDVAGGAFWKWMALEKGVLYALMGQQEQRDPTMRWQREAHGWPWSPISQGFNQPDKIKDSVQAYVAHPWGFGGSVLAIDPKTKKVLWSHQENEPVDGRAICMKNGRICIFRFGAYLACLDAKTGNVVWRKTPENAPDLFKALGPYSNRQGAAWNWRTTCYLKCSDEAIYFAGPQVDKLLAVSAKTGEVLWSNPYNNFQLILRDDKLYAISGQNDVGALSKIFDPLTGDVLAELQTGRRACTRPTGTLDAILYRAREGTTRLDLADPSRQPEPWYVAPMRPPCQDGVTVANGLLYWWPYVCDCQLTLYGAVCLGPAGGFNFQPQVTANERLELGDGDPRGPSLALGTPVRAGPNGADRVLGDWSTFRADNTCSATSRASIPEKTELLWRYEPKMTVPAPGPLPTAPVAAGGLVFVGGPDGIVRTLDAATGMLRWKAYTGGAIRVPPTVWKGRAFVGSGDGWVYALEAKTGRLLWRFRAAPAERRIPVYGVLQSTWPAASGVLVEDGIAYVAAGIVNYDQTYVYALDAETGRVKWTNDTSGHLNAQARCGVSVQGHLLLHDGKLYMAGGTSISPAVYDATNGKCLNDPSVVQRLTQNNVLFSENPRGWELSLLADRVVACGKPFYTHPKYEVYDPTVFSRVFLSSASGRDVVWATNQKNKRVLCFDNIDKAAMSRAVANPRNQFLVDWANLGVRDKPQWSYDCEDSRAVAVCANAVVVAGESQIAGLSMDDGRVLWSHPLPSAAVQWGLAIDSQGRAVVSLEDGTILCFGRAA